MEANLSTTWLRRLMILAALLIGLLSGGNFDRSTVAMPAWEMLGPAAWADFSRQADLGNGRAVYPILAFAGTLACCGASLVFLLAGRSQRKSGPPILGSAIAMVASIPASLKAAPYMLSLADTPDNDLHALRTAFSGFEFWGRWQGILHICAFLLALIAIAALGVEQNH
ncbi:MAG: hypothetical protein M3O31_16515 [Acidobacteriota bacterium]|nr:hypothetical protein [Acidobacteriota bacterium]